MAHFAKLDENNIVLKIHVVDNVNAPTEAAGIAYLKGIHGWDKWKQTSYNTYGNIHKLGGTPFRGNHAGEGGSYNETHDIFIGPQPHTSWTLNISKCKWEAPVIYPTDTTYTIKWDEPNLRWIGKNESGDSFVWDTNTNSWT